MLGGIAVFVAAERATSAALAACGLRLPSSVIALCILGTVAAVPANGAMLQRALGPATTWLRASLPVLLVPAFMFPFVCEVPDREALPKLALLATTGVLATCAATGHVASALVRGAAPAVGGVPCSQTAVVAHVLSSLRWAIAAVGVGGLLTLAMQAWYPDASSAQAQAPLYMGLTLAFHNGVVRLLPASARRFCPPNVGCALVLLPLLLTVGGAREVRAYLDGAGCALLAAVQPAMVTLGLYTHTHRSVMAGQARALLVLATLVAPSLLFSIAYAGAALGLEPTLVASVLPASTTTGLALTWPSGLGLIQEEWVAAGTAFNSGLVQVTLPLLLGWTRLTSPLGRGVGIGCTAHVGGMAALLSTGEIAAADAAAVALVVVGVARSVLVQVPPVSRALSEACSAGCAGGDDAARAVDRTDLPSGPYAT